METGWKALVARWAEAGVIDAETADRIRVFEEQRAPAAGWRWPVLLALALGSVLIGAAVLLFVSAHWDALSPGMRFGLVLAMVGVFHLGAVSVTDRFPTLASVLHAVGTVSLGAGIFLAGQIFNMDEHWPSGVMLWAIGAALAWMLLRDAPQLALAATLVPAWLVSEWIERIRWTQYESGGRVAACGVFSLALAYFAAPDRERPTGARRALLWLGGLALLPAALAMASSTSATTGFLPSERPPLSISALTVGWMLALALPMTVAILLRGRSAWIQAVAMGWAVVLLYLRPVAGEVSLYGWWALGSIGLVVWGLRDGRSERINLGAAIFAITVLAFYFSEVMDKLERSVSLAGLGILFLAGGWALERTRRRLVRRARGEQV